MALDRLAALGARIDVFDNPVAYGDLADDNGLITAVEAYANHGAYYGDESLPMDEDVRKRMLTGQTYSGHEYVRKLERRNQLIREFGMCIEGFDALVTPSTIGTAPALSTIDQAIAPGYFTRPFNYLAMCALSVPISLNDSGLPTSLQIVGRAHDEAMVLRMVRRSKKTCRQSVVLFWPRPSPNSQPAVNFLITLPSRVDMLLS